MLLVILSPRIFQAPVLDQCSSLLHHSATQEHQHCPEVISTQYWVHINQLHSCTTLLWSLLSNSQSLSLAVHTDSLLLGAVIKTDYHIIVERFMLLLSVVSVRQFVIFLVLVCQIKFYNIKMVDIFTTCNYMEI